MSTQVELVSASPYFPQCESVQGSKQSVPNFFTIFKSRETASPNNTLRASALNALL